MFDCLQKMPVAADINDEAKPEETVDSVSLADVDRVSANTAVDSSEGSLTTQADNGVESSDDLASPVPHSVPPSASASSSPSSSSVVAESVAMATVASDVDLSTDHPAETADDNNDPLGAGPDASTPAEIHRCILLHFVTL